jgi:hypothetical protein
MKYRLSKEWIIIIVIIAVLLLSKISIIEPFQQSKTEPSTFDNFDAVVYNE